jgi:NADH-quinone oxidoreductase subunit M
MPLFGGISLIVVLSSMGLPGLNGFVGEFTILLGSIGSEVLSFFFTMFATIGVILAAVYMLWMFQKVYMGDVDKEENRNLPPLHWQEVAVLVPIVVVIFLIGLQPRPFFDTMTASTEEVVRNVAVYFPDNAGEALAFELPEAETAMLTDGE